MNCPVCGREARTRVYWCAKCAVLVHSACWPKHKADSHKESKGESRISPYARRRVLSAPAISTTRGGATDVAS